MWVRSAMLLIRFTTPRFPANVRRALDALFCLANGLADRSDASTVLSTVPSAVLVVAIALRPASLQRFANCTISSIALEANSSWLAALSTARRSSLPRHDRESQLNTRRKLLQGAARCSQRDLTVKIPVARRRYRCRRRRHERIGRPKHPKCWVSSAWPTSAPSAQQVKAGALCHGVATKSGRAWKAQPTSLNSPPRRCSRLCSWRTSATKPAAKLSRPPNGRRHRA